MGDEETQRERSIREEGEGGRIEDIEVEVELDAVDEHDNLSDPSKKSESFCIYSDKVIEFKRYVWTVVGAYKVGERINQSGKMLVK